MDLAVASLIVGILGVFLAVIAVVVTVVNPELRRRLGLEKGVSKTTLVVKDISNRLFNLSSLYARTDNFAHVLPSAQDSFLYFGREAWSVSSDDDVVIQGQRYTGVRKRGSSPKFLLTSQTGAVITGVALRLDEYSPPPLIDDFQIVAIVSGGVGGGPVPGIRFEPIEVTPHQVDYDLIGEHNEFDPTSILPYQLDPGDSIQINPSITFLEDGDYAFHVVVHATNLEEPSEDVRQFRSPRMHYRHVFIPRKDIQRLPTMLQPREPS